nr:NB-ARC domains-containing protein [Tanacetum cinerariifolium]
MQNTKYMHAVEIMEGAAPWTLPGAAAPWTLLPGALPPTPVIRGFVPNNNHDNVKQELEVLPELPISLLGISASDCTSLREVTGSSKDPFKNRRDTREWKEAKKFITFCFEENNEDVEVKECGVRLICGEDLEQQTDLSMLQGLPTPTQHGGMLGLTGLGAYLYLSWRDTREWKEAKKFITYCFEENNEDVEVKECGVRLICGEDLEQQTDL